MSVFERAVQRDKSHTRERAHDEYRRRYVHAEVAIPHLVEAGAQLLARDDADVRRRIVVVALHAAPPYPWRESAPRFPELVLVWAQATPIAAALFAEWRPKLRRGEIPVPIILNAAAPLADVASPVVCAQCLDTVACCGECAPTCDACRRSAAAREVA